MTNNQTHKFIVGNMVKWRSSNADKTGIVVAVVPPRTKPKDVGFDIKGCGMSRDDVSYVVKGRVNGSNRGDGLYWPLVQLLSDASQLTVEEIEWCHANVEAVRELMNS